MDCGPTNDANSGGRISAEEAPQNGNAPDPTTTTAEGLQVDLPHLPPSEQQQCHPVREPPKLSDICKQRERLLNQLNGNDGGETERYDEDLLMTPHPGAQKKQ